MKNLKTIVIGVLILLLAVSITLLVRQEKRTERAEREAVEYKKYVDAVIIENNKVLEAIRSENDSLTQFIKENKIIVIREKQFYETVKKSSINTNYTSSELAEWVKSFESKAGSSK